MIDKMICVGKPSESFIQFNCLNMHIFIWLVKKIIRYKNILKKYIIKNIESKKF